MRKASWEIIIAGFLFVGLGIYLLERNASKNDDDNEVTVAVSVLSNKDKEKSRSTTVIQLSELSALNELERLESLKKLKELEKLEALESLEELAVLEEIFPEEVQIKLEREFEELAKQLSEQNINISIDNNQLAIVVDHEYKTEEGEWSASSPGVYSYVKKFDASKLDDITVDIMSGSIEVMGTNSDTGVLTIEASGKVASVNDLKEVAVPSISVSDDAFVVKLDAPQKHNQSSNIQFHVKLQVPKKLADVLAKTAGGHIEVNDVAADLVISTNGGHITINKSEGDVTAKTNGGHISAEQMYGDLELITSGGHISLIKNKGDAFLKTSGGNIEAVKIEGEVTAETGGGNVDVEITRLSDDVTAKTGAGSVVIKIPSNSNVDIDAKGTSVEVDGNFKYKGTVSKKSANIQVGSGGDQITASSGYGNVKILRKN
ncbi:MAG: hypothetical protein AAFW89_02110 [Bacteroidota bacterium]